jgi:hypothetical protein
MRLAHGESLGISVEHQSLPTARFESRCPSSANAKKKISRASKRRSAAMSPQPTQSAQLQAGPDRPEDEAKAFELARIVGAARVNDARPGAARASWA